MSGFRPPINPEVKEDIEGKIKEGLSVTAASKQFGVATKTIYGWLTKKATGDPSTLEFVRLKKENQELYALVGRITSQLERSKKK